LVGKPVTNKTGERIGEITGSRLTQDDAVVVDVRLDDGE
jgi:hypothetical protein